MYDTTVSAIICDMVMNTPAKQECINQVEIELQIVLPKQYVEFMLTYNGGEGPIGESEYLVIFTLDRVIQHNRLLHSYWPNYIFFASDGGDESYAFDRFNDMVIVRIPFLGTNDDVDFYIDTFYGLLFKLWSYKEENE